MSAECRVNTVDKSRPLEVQWLVEEADGSGVQCAGPNGLVGMGGDENNRNVKAAMRQMILQVDAAHVWHLDVKYQTPRFRDR